MKRILVLGSSGMAGHVITTHLLENEYKVDTISAHIRYNEDTLLIDLYNNNTIEKTLKKKYDYVINCVAILDCTDKNIDKAIYLNSFFPHYLEKILINTHTKLIHISTDGVFNGDKGQYKETDATNSNTLYGLTKSLGEVLNSKDITIRTSIIGPEYLKKGNSFFSWFINNLDKEVNGYTRVMWSGISTIELAKAIRSMIEQDASGIYHLVPSKPISKYELLLIINKVFNKDTIIKEDNSKISDLSLINTRTDLGYVIPSYEKIVRDIKSWILEHPDFYQAYEIK